MPHSLITSDKSPCVTEQEVPLLYYIYTLFHWTTILLSMFVLLLPLQYTTIILLLC